MQGSGGNARRKFLISTKELLSPLTSQRVPTPPPPPPTQAHARADVGAPAPVGDAWETSGNSLQSSVWQIKPYKRPRKHI